VNVKQGGELAIMVLGMVIVGMMILFFTYMSEELYNAQTADSFMSNTTLSWLDTINMTTNWWAMGAMIIMFIIIFYYLRFFVNTTTKNR